MKKIKIAVIAHGCRTGGGLFGTLNLMRSFKNVAINEEILLICSKGYGYEGVELPQGSDVFVYKGSQNPLARQWFERVTLPAIIDSYGADVVFGPGNIGIVNPKVPQALFIRMPYMLYDKKYYPNATFLEKIRFAALRSQICKSLPKTKLVYSQTPIVSSRFSKSFNYPENQIKTLRLPCPTEINRTSDLDVPNILENSSGNFYILVLTRYMTHRNPDILIPLCKKYGKEIREKGIKFITTVEANEHVHAPKFLEKCSRNKLDDIIINVGRLSRQEVSRYYTHTDLLWLPTMMETLCLPFLEAMTVGSAILAPDLDFARYVCGDAAVFYDPWDIDSIFNKICFIKENDVVRQDLIDKGKTQIKNMDKFSRNWEEVAAEVLCDMRQLATITPPSRAEI